MISLAGRVALITGGSRGIGAATVKLFAQAGADVIFSYRRNREAALSVVQEASAYARVESIKADLTRMADAKAVVSRTIRRFGKLDILVVNAGIWNAEDAPIEKLTEKSWDEMIRVNLRSIYTITHCAALHMISQRSGRMIIVSSTAAQRGEAFHSHYAASKGGAISFVKSLSTELAGRGILVNCVAPGWVDTDMSRPVLRTKRGEKLASEIPVGRVATANEIAGPILFLASDLATFMTGEIVNVNGGAVLCG